MNLLFDWEIIDKKEQIGEWLDCTTRTKVIGGWIVNRQIVATYQKESLDRFSFSTNGSMVFIPDSEHKWIVDK